MTATVLHDTFVLERDYPVPPARVFHAFADLEAKQRWFRGPEEWSATGEHTLDFRVGGQEHEAGGPPGGPVSGFHATYLDIVPDRRIIYSYTMDRDGTPMSVSLTTVELVPTAEGTHLRLTEHGAYLDTADAAWGPASRIEGTEGLLDQLGASLTGPA